MPTKLLTNNVIASWSRPWSEVYEKLLINCIFQEDDIAVESDEPILGLDGKPLKPPPPTLPFTLDRPEYYTVPGTEDLVDLIKEESLVVKDLVVGRTGWVLAGRI